MTEPLWQIKKQMCEIGHRIWLKGFCAGNEGNHSVRLSDDRVLCTPTGLSKGILQPQNLCVVNMQGKQVERNANGHTPTTELQMHLAIYKARPDVKAVIHSHPPHATAFAIANMPLPEGIHPEAELFLGKVPVSRYATPSTADLPASIVELIKPDTNTVLMSNHGSVSFDKTLESTYHKLEILDAYCRILLLCKQLGKANVLSNTQMTQLLEVKNNQGRHDDRLACAPDGCVGENNDAFLASFDVRPSTASCSCNGGKAHHHHDETPVAPATFTDGDPAFEAMVRAITNQIMHSSTSQA